MKSDYKITIGLEVHAELKTKTKMFCGCLNDPDEKEPNKNVCPICLGHPGVLPVPNEAAIDSIVRIGLTVGGTIPSFSKFDRKSYFYPDLPKGYQISQYDEPLVKGGEVAGVKLTRIHLEEDTARSIHDREGGSLVDFNRAGIPLMELVTEPVITSADEALKMAKELQLILRYLDASEANMEKGEMRVEANVSVSKDSKLGTKVEIKNINSFRSLKDAIEFEVRRQMGILEQEGKIVQETRGWDETIKATMSSTSSTPVNASRMPDITYTPYAAPVQVSSAIPLIFQRTKEEAHDYRYIPEPDIPPIKITEEKLEELRSTIPELPSAKRERFVKEYGLDRISDVLFIFIEDRFLADYFEKVVSESDELSKSSGEDRKVRITLIVNYLLNDLVRLMNERIIFNDARITPENLAEFIELIVKGQLSSRIAKDVLKEMFETGADPDSIVAERDLAQISAEEDIKKFVQETIGANPKAVEDYKKGKKNAFQFLVGKIISASKGKVNAELAGEILEAELRKQ